MAELKMEESEAYKLTVTYPFLLLTDTVIYSHGIFEVSQDAQHKKRIWIYANASVSDQHKIEGFDKKKIIKLSNIALRGAELDMRTPPRELLAGEPIIYLDSHGGLVAVRYKNDLFLADVVHYKKSRKAIKKILLDFILEENTEGVISKVLAQVGLDNSLVVISQNFPRSLKQIKAQYETVMRDKLTGIIAEYRRKQQEMMQKVEQIKKTLFKESVFEAVQFLAKFQADGWTVKTKNGRAYLYKDVKITAEKVLYDGVSYKLNTKKYFVKGIYIPLATERVYKAYCDDHFHPNAAGTKSDRGLYEVCIGTLQGRNIQSVTAAIEDLLKTINMGSAFWGDFEDMEIAEEIEKEKAVWTA